MTRTQEQQIREGAERLMDEIGLLDEGFKALDTKSQLYGIIFFARLGGETKVEQVAAKLYEQFS